MSHLIESITKPVKQALSYFGIIETLEDEEVQQKTIVKQRLIRANITMRHFQRNYRINITMKKSGLFLMNTTQDYFIVYRH